MSETTPNAASGLAAAARATAGSQVAASPSASVQAAGKANNGSPATGAPAALSPVGLVAAVASFVIWGVFPIYLKPLHDVPSLQIVAHRIAWSCVLVIVWMLVRGELGELRKPLTNPAILGRLAITAVLITINWLGYVWGVGHGHVVETSLGYFINPLVNVLLGVVVLRERLNLPQWTAVAAAVIAVVYLGIIAGAPPWIALTVATSFSVYGLMRKMIRVEALPGLATETLVLMPLALGYLIWCEAHGTGALGHSGFGVAAWLVGCGPMTAVPLFLFAYGARLIPYSTLGLLLYIAPSLQLLCGVFLYHEPFQRAQAFGFALIWLALLIYAGDGLWRSRKARVLDGGAPAPA
jgi:chloramphenicol-sensitive protein RarD